MLACLRLLALSPLISRLVSSRLVSLGVVSRESLRGGGSDCIVGKREKRREEKSGGAIVVWVLVVEWRYCVEVLGVEI